MIHSLRIGVMALFLFALNANAGAKVDFTGTWILDKTKSIGQFLGEKQVMVVTQKDNRLEVKTSIISPEGEERTLNDLYVLDGKETEFTPPLIGVTGKGKRMSKWSDDGSGLDVAEQTDLDLPEGPAHFKKMGKWSLSADAKTLTIQMSIVRSEGTTEFKLVFAKK